ncbi:hypothetical protein OpiT1DRAFT_01016 [Opitutaceae bacterium TAV1]|nr:hypothetical protein OpiT1DRAFT_01016 [Opitutaceae bacterium TAV1]
MKTIVSTTKILTGIIAFCAQAHAALILNETFSDNDLTNQALPDSAAWYWVHGNNDGNNTIAVQDGALYVTFTRNTGNPALITYFTPVSLQSVGDSLTVSFTLKTPASFPGGGWPDALRFGFYDSNDSRLDGDRGTWSSTDGAVSSYEGYAVRGPVGNVSGSVAIQGRSTGNNDLFASGTSVDSISYVANTLEANGTCNFSLSLTRTATGIQYSFTYGALTLTGVDTNPSSWQFDTFAIGFLSNAYATDSGFILDDVRIETSSIPEPTATACFLGLLAFALIPVLRRLRAGKK